MGSKEEDVGRQHGAQPGRHGDQNDHGGHGGGDHDGGIQGGGCRASTWCLAWWSS